MVKILIYKINLKIVNPRPFFHIFHNIFRSLYNLRNLISLNYYLRIRKVSLKSLFFCYFVKMKIMIYLKLIFYHFIMLHFNSSFFKPLYHFLYLNLINLLFRTFLLIFHFVYYFPIMDCYQLLH